MRIANILVGIMTVAGAVAPFTVAGCSSSSGSGAGSDSGTPAESGTGDDTGALADTGGNPGSDAGTDTGAAADSGGAEAGPACAPTASCTAADKSCLGLVSNAGQTKFGLRMSELDLSKPSSLASGLLQQTLAGAMAPSDATCNLQGSGTFSWLLQFDTAAGILKTGGARPVANPAQGYAFDSEMLGGLNVQPGSFMAKPDSSGNFSTAGQGQTFVLPVFLDAAGTSMVLLPLSQTTFTMGTLSASQDCIGSYNAAGLSPTNSCQPATNTPQFLDGASVSAFIALTDADSVTITALSESLCVLLSGNATMYGDGATPVAHCKKDASANILYQGDWCSTTNAAAAAGCADAVSLTGQFAASSVLITN